MAMRSLFFAALIARQPQKPSAATDYLCSNWNREW